MMLSWLMHSLQLTLAWWDMAFAGINRWDEHAVGEGRRRKVGDHAST